MDAHVHVKLGGQKVMLDANNVCSKTATSTFGKRSAISQRLLNYPCNDCLQTKPAARYKHEDFQQPGPRFVAFRVFLQRRRVSFNMK
jgi:hypothetical protein